MEYIMAAIKEIKKYPNATPKLFIKSTFGLKAI
jgi:hypothetical protein